MCGLSSSWNTITCDQPRTTSNVANDTNKTSFVVSRTQYCVWLQGTARSSSLVQWFATTLQFWLAGVHMCAEERERTTSVSLCWPNTIFLKLDSSAGSKIDDEYTSLKSLNTRSRSRLSSRYSPKLPFTSTAPRNEPVCGHTHTSANAWPASDLSGISTSRATPTWNRLSRRASNTEMPVLVRTPNRCVFGSTNTCLTLELNSRALVADRAGSGEVSSTLTATSVPNELCATGETAARAVWGNQTCRPGVYKHTFRPHRTPGGRGSQATLKRNNFEKVIQNIFLVANLSRLLAGVVKGLEPQIPADLGAEFRQHLGNTLDVLVSSSRNVDDDVLVLGHGLGLLQSSVDGMRRLERRNDTLVLRKQTEPFQGLRVGSSNKLHTAQVLPGRKLGSNTRIVQSGRNRVSVVDLAVRVLQNVRLDSVENTRLSGSQRGRVSVCVQSVSSSLDSQKLDAAVFLERREHTGGVRASTNARNNKVWSNSRANNVVCVCQMRHPVSEGLRSGVSQSLGTVGDGNDVGSEDSHPEHVQSLSSDVLCSHENRTLDTELGTGSGSGHTVLAGSGLCDDVGLAESSGNQDLCQSVVDLVRSGMVEVLSLEPDLGAARACRASGTYWPPYSPNRGLCKCFSSNLTSSGRFSSASIKPSPTVFSPSPVRIDLTYFLAASPLWPLGVSSRMVTSFEPITTPSELEPTCKKCSLVDTPNPTANGALPPVSLRTRSTRLPTVALTEMVAPVVPIRETT
ncbi:hypothetical protein OGAPHI_001030 [Ogataea philodendri]|uniref:Uncharacterized protein n=1 Tax=Ogataea philodendri TaxID=1378263 RepID=A0A9P8PF66_9ASCO|nr:uncharacterized protein OGAPHI_001030 [Ogataea philodendri]KAH3670515.1 hypothetical protein OGAPHI_001030 [Ogataea philodendri]